MLQQRMKIMASKRHIRRRSCESKVVHQSEQDAIVHARRLGSFCVPYHCSFCNKWHVGRPDRSKRQSLIAKAKNRREEKPYLV